MNYLRRPTMVLCLLLFSLNAQSQEHLQILIPVERTLWYDGETQKISWTIGSKNTGVTSFDLLIANIHPDSQYVSLYSKLTKDSTTVHWKIPKGMNGSFRLKLLANTDKGLIDSAKSESPIVIQDSSSLAASLSGLIRSKSDVHGNWYEGLGFNLGASFDLLEGLKSGVNPLFETLKGINWV